MTEALRLPKIYSSSQPAQPAPEQPVGDPFFIPLLQALQHIQFGSLTLTLPQGQRYDFKGKYPGPKASVVLHNRKTLQRMALHGRLGFGEAYMHGDATTDDIVALLCFAQSNEQALSQQFAVPPWIKRWLTLWKAVRRNSRLIAQSNIRAHYDLGNDFYSQWLDSGLTYSGAIFAYPNQDLAAAQQNKYAHLAQLMNLTPGAKVLDIGCGWGGFAEYLATQREARVTGITISNAQYRFAVERMLRSGLSERVNIIRQDYRDTRGQFDAIGSIEMFEAVGQEYWDTYFTTLRRLLKPNGIAALQVITIDEKRFAAYSSVLDFIQKYIFPGGMLPTRSHLQALAAKHGFSVVAEVPYGEHYARTITLWRERFEAKWPAIQSLGFDERFKRLWTYYLAYCETGFALGTTNVYQFAWRRCD